MGLLLYLDGLVQKDFHSYIHQIEGPQSLQHIKGHFGFFIFYLGLEGDRPLGVAKRVRGQAA